MKRNRRGTVAELSRYNEDMEEAKRRGPVPGPKTARYTLMLEPDDADWAKHQPGGLSEMVRRLLKEERRRQEKQGQL